MPLPLVDQLIAQSSSLLPTPPSLLISKNPQIALRIFNKPDQQHQSLQTSSAKRPRPASDLGLFARPPPPSKRPRRTRPASQPQPPLSTRSLSSASSSLSETLSSPGSVGRGASPDSEVLLPALPRLPPTPLTPVELLRSPTLGRVFGRSSEVFLQVAASTTGLVEAELPTANRLAELVDVLRGDLGSRAWVEVVQRLAGRDPAEGESHYAALSRTADIIQGLFTASYPVCLPALASAPEPPSLGKRPETTSTTTTTSTETLSPEAQKVAFSDALLTLTRFLGDLRDYRDRLVEIRNGCLAVEKRRRAVWAIVKVCAKAFEESCGGPKKAGGGEDEEDDEDGGGEGGEHARTTSGLGVGPAGLANGDSRRLGNSSGVSNTVFTNGGSSFPNNHHNGTSTTSGTGSNNHRSSKGKSRQTSER